MATPFKILGNIVMPPESGQPEVASPFGGASSFESKMDSEFNFTGSGTQTVDFGTIDSPGLKGFVLEVDASSTAAPVQVRYNAGDADGQMEVSPGGCIAYFNPTPASGITAMSIVYTTPVKVRLRLLG